MPASEYKSLMELLITRLERISADSYWAHRASGVRGALIRLLDGIDSGVPVSSIEIKQITALGFYILEQASLITKNSGSVRYGKRAPSI